MEMNNSYTVSLRVVLLVVILFLSVVSDGTYGHQHPQFTPLHCNNTAICAFSQPLTFLYSVLSVTSCATECHFKQYQSAPCVGFNYQATNKSCDIFVKEPKFFDIEAGCQYYHQRTGGMNWNCTTLPGLQSASLVTSFPGYTSVLATAILNVRLFVTRYYVAQVSVYNTTSLQLVQQITFPGLGIYLFGLATSVFNNSNYLYISDSGCGCVHRVNLSVTSSVSVMSWNVTGRISPGMLALSVTSAGNVIVVTNNNVMWEYTPSGSLVRTITRSITVWQAVQVSKDIWAFTVVGTKNGICTTLTNGTLIKCFTGSEVGSGITPMNIPRYLSLTAGGYILVTDRNNNRILVVDPSLSEARPIQLPLNTNLTAPLALSFDQSRGRLYVGEDGIPSRVLVFDGIWLL